MNIFKRTYINSIDENFQIHRQNKIPFIDNKKKKKTKSKITSEVNI